MYRLLISKDDLKRIRIIQDEVHSIPKRRAECLKESQKLFLIGLENKDEKQVTFALQCFRNMNALKEQVRLYMDDISAEFEGMLNQIFESTARSTYTSSEGKTIPGSASLPNISVASAVQSSLWPHMNDLFEFVKDLLKKMIVLHGVTQRKRDTVSHKLWSDLIGHDDEDRLWRALAYLLQQKFSDHTAFRLTFQSNYPQLLRMINSAFLVPNQLAMTTSAIGSSDSSGLTRDSFYEQYKLLRKSALVLENAFVAKSLSRMFSSVESAFEDSSKRIPDEATTEIVVKSLSIELSAVEFDGELFSQVFIFSDIFSTFL
ncbi:unnamed protein product [Soboliphyme baturini]|uniref:Conserved oligomeric Golgi complex subunit 5 n=1 Tax=Soboliphyme baturini TaxID=241478 RepID=A0A183J770_9BILA|nr:unnamed protein product [Soboliphyme baturini]